MIICHWSVRKHLLHESDSYNFFSLIPAQFFSKADDDAFVAVMIPGKKTPLCLQTYANQIDAKTRRKNPMDEKEKKIKKEENRDCCRTNNKNECSLCSSHKRTHTLIKYSHSTNVQSFCCMLFSIIGCRIQFLCYIHQTRVWCGFLFFTVRSKREFQHQFKWHVNFEFWDFNRNHLSVWLHWNSETAIGHLSSGLHRCESR